MHASLVDQDQRPRERMPGVTEAAKRRAEAIDRFWNGGQRVIDVKPIVDWRAIIITQPENTDADTDASS